MSQEAEKVFGSQNRMKRGMMESEKETDHIRWSNAVPLVVNEDFDLAILHNFFRSQYYLFEGLC